MVVLWGLFSSGFISSTLLPGGSELLLLYLLDQQQQSVWLLLAVVTLGNSLGGVVTWGMGYWVYQRFPTRNLSPRQQQAQRWFSRYGAPVLLLSWLPLIGDPLCFISGWLRQRFVLCVLLIVVGKAVRYLLLASPWL
jgi:membrane protein YqaA with SNARE-associated domain